MIPTEQQIVDTVAISRIQKPDPSPSAPMLLVFFTVDASVDTSSVTYVLDGSVGLM